jgi:flavin-dependent thymidylate synthase
MKNSVELLGYYGSDEVIACSAWTSTSRDLNEEKRARIPKLIHQLWSNGHETPFEKGVVHFLVDTEIASHIHILKHRISSMNAESARYKELKEDKYYLPYDWSNIKVSKNVGFDPTEFTPDGYDNGFYYAYEDSKWLDVLEEYTKQGNMLYHQCVEDLTPTLGRKRAKESARFFKTYNSQIQGDVSFNMRSFGNFQKLRNSKHSQIEIQNLAEAMLNIVKNLEGKPFQHTLEAWKNSEIISSDLKKM